MIGLDKVVSLINNQNPGLPYPISVSNVTFDPPGNPVGNTAKNTGVLVKGIVGYGYRGEVEVHYDRVPLGQLFSQVTPAFRTQQTSFGIDHVVERLNAVYGLDLTIDDVEPVPTLTYDTLETTKPVEVVVRSTSYNWMGTVTVQATYGNPLLTGVVVVHLLPILKHPVDLKDLGTSKYGPMCLYNFDFTAFKKDLVINPTTRKWDNFNKVQAIGKKAGLTWWYNSWVSDMPTSAVPDANQAFERVMVQNYTGGGTYGKLYFHYDQNW